jgi:Secretory lipase
VRLATRPRVLLAAAAAIVVSVGSAPALAHPFAAAARSSVPVSRESGTAIPLPQHDPFYRAPAGWRVKRPGTILRHRPVTLATFARLPQRVQSWQLMFRTTSTTGKPMVAVTTVLMPAGGRPRSLLSYQIAEDAAAPQCAPSYELRLSGSRTEAANQVELLLIDAAVGEGFAVSVPDYEGVQGDFGAARQPGYAVLDGLRAAEHFAPLQLPGRKTPTAIWGYSGGSLASGWAAQVQHHYAPELRLRGVALGGFVTDVSQALLTINGGPGSGLVASALPGVLKSSPGLARLLAPQLTSAGRRLLAHSGAQCEVQNLAQYPFVNFDRYLRHPIASLLARPAIAKQMARLNLGRTAPSAPLFVYHAVHDELIPIQGPDTIVPRYCAHGDSVRYTRDDASEHVSLAVTGAAAALDWLTTRASGQAPPRGCTTTTVPTMAVSSSALQGYPVVVRSILLALTDLPISGSAEI